MGASDGGITSDHMRKFLPNPVPNDALHQAEPQPAFVIAGSCSTTFGIAAPIDWQPHKEGAQAGKQHLFPPTEGLSHDAKSKLKNERSAES